MAMHLGNLPLRNSLYPACSKAVGYRSEFMWLPGDSKHCIISLLQEGFMGVVTIVNFLVGLMSPQTNRWSFLKFVNIYLVYT